MSIYDSVTLWAGKVILDVLIFSGVLFAFAALVIALWGYGKIKDALERKGRVEE